MELLKKFINTNVSSDVIYPDSLQNSENDKLIPQVFISDG